MAPTATRAGNTAVTWHLRLHTCVQWHLRLCTCMQHRCDLGYRVYPIRGDHCCREAISRPPPPSQRHGACMCSVWAVVSVFQVPFTLAVTPHLCLQAPQWVGTLGSPAGSQSPQQRPARARIEERREKRREGAVGSHTHHRYTVKQRYICSKTRSEHLTRARLMHNVQSVACLILTHAEHSEDRGCQRALTSNGFFGGGVRATNTFFSMTR